MPDIKPIAEELGFTAAVGVMLPNSHFGRVWKDPESDNCIWQLVLMEADKDTPIGNGMATSLADATNALFNYAQCWVLAGETVGGRTATQPNDGDGDRPDGFHSRQSTWPTWLVTVDLPPTPMADLS